jgi:hypothetical protein
VQLEVFIQCFERGKAAGVPTAAIREVFGPNLEIVDEENWKVFYDEKNWCNVWAARLPSDHSRVCLVSIADPCDDSRLWESLFAILKLGSFVLYWSTRCLLVADSAVTQDLPRGIVESAVRVQQVLSGSDIRHELEST